MNPRTRRLRRAKRLHRKHTEVMAAWYAIAPRVAPSFIAVGFDPVLIRWGSSVITELEVRRVLKRARVNRMRRMLRRGWSFPQKATLHVNGQAIPCEGLTMSLERKRPPSTYRELGPKRVEFEIQLEFDPNVEITLETATSSAPPNGDP